MTITKNNFDKGTFEKKANDRYNHPVARLLRSNKRVAYTVDEIAENTDMNENTVRSILRKMINDDKTVEHKQPFFCWVA